VIIAMNLDLISRSLFFKNYWCRTLRKEDGFKLREYESHILAETTVDGAFEDAGSEAFDRLFKYISGNNKQQKKVAMTSPVGQEPSSQKI
jgi:hypothetical protein